MKITVFLFFSGLIGLIAAPSYSQNTRISLNMDNASIEDVLNKIEDESEFYFFFNQKLIDVDRKVSVHADNEPIKDILDGIFENDVKYVVFDRQIILNTTKGDGVSAISAMQQRVITGKVSDASGAALPGVSVIIKGTTKGVLTDFKGIYSIPDVPANATLQFSFIGMKLQEVTVGMQNSIDIIMIEELTALDEVVVVGYGTQRRVDLTGSVSSVDATKIASQPVIGVDQALVGRAAGVQVTQNTGAPGGNVSVRIRGVGSISSTSEPLYIVDGLPFQPVESSINPLNAINPNEIESVEILKDAGAAAIYGARASNGVVLITTKRGKSGQAKVDFDMYYGVQSPTKTIDLLNGPQYASLANEATANFNADPSNTKVVPNPIWANPSSLSSTNWQDAVFNPAPIQSYNLSVSGGTDKLRSSLSGGYMKQDGILINSDYQRISIRINNDYQIIDKLKIGNNLSITNENVTPNDDGQVIEQAFQMFPDQPVYAPDGPQSPTVYGYHGYAMIPNSVDGLYYPIFALNPVFLAYDARENKRINNRILGSLFGEYEIINGLRFRTSIGIDYANNLSTSHLVKIPENLRGGNSQKEGYSESTYRGLTWNFVNTLTFTRTLGEKHDISILVGSDVLRNSSATLSGNATEFLNPNIYNISSGAVRIAEGSSFDYGLVSYIGRLTYAYNNKYLLAFNVRSDASSNFASENRQGVFPSGSIGWKISEEEFLANATFINDFKIRASWGVLGNQNIPPFQYLSTYSTANRTYTLGQGAQTGYTGSFPTNLGNPSIQWESVEQFDFGVDATLFGNKLNLILDYYIKENNDMLITEPRPRTFPMTSVRTNAASMRNQGIEFTIGYNKNTGSFQWNASLNLTTLKNEVTGLGGLGLPINRDLTGGRAYNDAATRTEVGQPIGYFWGLQTDGIFQNDAEVAAAKGAQGVVQPGDRKYVDQNKDGRIDQLDRINLGVGIPDLILGLSFSANYNNFDFSLLLAGQFGAEIANANKRVLYDLVQQQGAGLVNVSKDMLGHWTGEGTSNTIPRVTLDTPSNNILFSDFYIESGDFVRMRNIQLGYTFTKIPKVSRLRLYLSAQNLFTISSYSGFDPEIGSQNQNQLVTGYDQNRYPSARTILGGINLSF